MTAVTDSIRIVPYDRARPEHPAAFRALNLAWIEQYFTVEPADLRQLDDPEGTILAPGGAILFAETAPGPAGAIEILGTCALVAEPDAAFELAKMAVDERARGRGIGRLLGEAALAEARRLRARRVELVSNRSLGPALALYRTLGFVEVPLPPSEYARADIKMVLELAR
jgi:GNAT superfamily N-acetyltransferase